jgi:hypothetical protein
MRKKIRRFRTPHSLDWVQKSQFLWRAVLGAMALVAGGCSGDVQLDGSSIAERLRTEANETSSDGDLRLGPHFFVAPDGNDANPGSEQQPFLTLERARAAVRDALASGTGPIRVWLREGTYRRTAPFELAPRDSGHFERPITWSAYPGERAEISGLRRVAGPWTPFANGIWATSAEGLRFSTLFVNGARATRARAPNTGTYDMIVRPECCLDSECSGGPPTPQWHPPVHCIDRFIAQPGSVRADWRNLHDVEIVSRRRWEQSRHRIERVDEMTATVFVRAETSTWAFGFDYDGTDRYYVENVFEALDQPGEWYLDAPADRLYYIPQAGIDPNQSSIEFPVTDELLRAGDVAAAADIVSEDLIIVPDDDDLRFGDTSFSIAAWLSMPRSIPPCRLVQENPSVYHGSCVQPVVCKGDPFNTPGYCVIVSRVHDVNHAWVSIHMRDARGGMVQSPAVIVPAPTATADGEWKHYAWVVDRERGRLRTYVGGELTSSIALVPMDRPRAFRSIGTWHPLAVGRLTSAIRDEPHRYEASVDELHVIDGALTVTGVRSLFDWNTQSEAPERLHLGFESAVPTSADAGRPIVSRGRLRIVPGKVGSAAVFNEPPPIGGFTGYLEHVTFSGLEFRGTDASLRTDGYHGSQSDHRLELPAAISLVTRHSAFTHGTVTGTGAAAIRVFGVDTEVGANEIRDTGSSGIEVGRLPPREAWTTYSDSFFTWLGAGSNLARSVRVLDNQIHAVGRRFPSATAILVAKNSENRIAGNRIYDTGYSGISVGWFTPTATEPNPHSMHDNVIERNEVYGTMKVLNDGAGIYLLGSQQGTVVRNNVVHDIRLTPLHRPRTSTDGDLLFGIYLDGTTANVSVTSNVTYRTETGGLILGSGLDPTLANHDNQVSNNVFVDGFQFQTVFLYAIHDSFERNIVYAAHPTPLQAPFFWTPGANPVQETLERSDYNLFYRADGDYDQLADWRELGYDEHSLQGQYPEFVAPANDDYSVPPESPAVRLLGFVPFTTQAGPPQSYCFEDRDCGSGQCVQRECR